MTNPSKESNPRVASRKPKHIKSALPKAGPMPLRDVVAELVDGFSDASDWPAGHRCTKDGPLACSHEHWADKPLLVRLAHIVAPGTSGPRDDAGGKKSKGTRGSPAPWASGPALLVDEAHRGAVRLDAELRDALDLGPLYVHRGWRIRDNWHPPLARAWTSVTTKAEDTPSDLAGATALRGLPLLLELLQEKDTQHPLAWGKPVNPDKPDRGRSWGEVEVTVRSWHSRAKELTGHSVKPAVVRRRRNALAGTRWHGPSCQFPWDCGHLTCRAAYLAAEPEWGVVVCPFCGSIGFRQNDVTGELYCDHPKCRDEAGRRPSWSIEAFMQPINDVANRMDDLLPTLPRVAPVPEESP